MARKLLYINGLAIIGVVLYHASAWGFISLFWWAHRYRPVGQTNFDQLGNLEYFGLRVIEQLVIFAVPALIFVSGYFTSIAAGQNDKTLKWDIALNRIKFLAIPFLLWSVVSLLFSILQGERYPLVDFVLIILTGKAADPFYFIPMLIQLYLLSPLLIFLVRNSWKPVLAVSAIIQVLVLFFQYITIMRPDLKLFSDLSQGVLFSSHIFWFVFGIVIGAKFTEFKNVLIQYKQLLLTGIFFFFTVGVVEWEILFRFSGREWITPQETLIDHLYTLSIVLTFLTSEKFKPPLFQYVTGIGAKSYAIYLTHTIVLISTAKIIYHIGPSVMEYQIIFQPILISVGLGIPLLLTYLVEKSFISPYYRYLLG